MKWPKEKEQNDDANNDLQNITQKNKRSSNNKPGGEPECSNIVSCSCSTYDTRENIQNIIFHIIELG